tara:strand:+ start:112 stop:450 length:339 start_codon:yes stop_codon:yes gene_type:complete
MNFKTKYKSCLSATNELQYIRSSDKPPNVYKENAPREKKANYTISNRIAVSSGKYLPINSERLSGQGVDSTKKIYNSLDLNTNDAFTTFGKIDNHQQNKVFKKDGIIYDLLN